MFFFTIVLFVASLGLGITAWRLWRTERDRSRARIAALAAAIDGPSSSPFFVPPLGEFAADQESELSAERATHERRDVIRPSPMAIAAEPIFNTERLSAVQGNLPMKLAFGGAMAIGVIVVIAMTSVEREPPAPGTAAHTSALELLSMTHSRSGESLTVTGLVRNAGSDPLQSITAVVFAFDRDGSFVTSGRAQLDDSTVGPGDDSPFQVLIPKVGDVGRYRVSFRSQAGVIRHVDRRPSGLRAAN